MPDMGAWESIVRHARRHGRDATHFDAMDLYLEGFPTAAVRFCVLAYTGPEGVVRYWTGVLPSDVLDVSDLSSVTDASCSSPDPADAELFVSAQEARDEATCAHLLTGREFRLLAVVR